MSGSKKDIVTCEVCGVDGEKCKWGYYEPWYDCMGKLKDAPKRDIDRGSPEGGHRLKYGYYPHDGAPQGFIQFGIRLCAPCHSIVAYDNSRRSIYKSREQLHHKINTQQHYYAWSDIKTDEASGKMFYSHNSRPFKVGMIVNIPGSDQSDKNDIRDRSEFKFVMITKVITDTVPSWAHDTKVAENPKYPQDKFVYMDGTISRQFSVYIETIPYELAKKNAALKILKWWRETRKA